MKLKRIKAVEMKLLVTARFDANISEQQARDFIKEAIAYAKHPSEAASVNDANRAIDISSLKVFVASKTTFNTETPHA